MKKTIRSRILSIVLVICLVAGMLPMTAQAIELEEGEFNPNTDSVNLDFNIQLTQEVSIEALVNNEHFGWLIKNEELTGYDGPMVAHDPCATYTIPAESDQAHSAGVATSAEAWIDDQRDEDGNLVGEGYYTLIWTGSINGNPVVSANPDSDSYTLTISVQPKGYPDKGIVPCSDPSNGTHDGEDWIWTQQFAMETDIELNYGTILNQDGGLAALFNLQNSNLSYELIMQQMTQVSNWVNFTWLAENYASMDALQQYVEEADPVNMIDGNYFFAYTDLRIEGQYPLSLVRAYNSRGYGGSLGKGFTHSFDYTLKEENGFAHVYLPGGEELIFLKLRDFETDDYYTVQNREFSLSNTSSGGYVMTYKRGNAYEFDASGRLTEIRNDLGLTVYTLTYSGDELSRVTGINGYLNYTWSGGHITEIADSTGRSVKYGYAGDNLISVTNPDGDTLSYGYDSNGYISSVKDFEGDEYLRNTYDDKGRVTEQVFINADVETTHSFSYDDSNLINTYVNEQGRETEYHYDEYRNLLYTKDDNGITTSNYTNYIASLLKDNQDNSTTYDIDDNGNVTQMTYPNGNVVSFVYAANNLISKISYVDGSAETFQYNADNSLSSYTDQNGNTTVYSYDSNGLLVQETNALGFSTNYHYDSAGRLLSVQDAEGGERNYEYDAVGRILKEHAKVNATDTATTSYTYSDAGKLLRVTDALGNVTEYSYNGNGFTTEAKDALGGTVTTEYGTNGQPLKMTDANGNVTTYAYATGTGLLESVTDPEGNATRYTYNDRGLLVSTTDAAGNETKHEYDSLDRLVKTTDALGGETSYEYDSMGRTVSVTDANGHMTGYSYDKLGRTVKMTDAEGNATSYIYDPVGNLLKTTDANGNSTSTEYNAVNWAVKSIDAEGNATTYEYDKVGRMVKVTNALGGETEYTYDLAGNMTSTTDPNGNVTRYVCDLLGRTVEQINADNSKTRNVYDALGQVVESYDELSGKTSYTYDANGNRLSVTDPLNHTTVYAYNGNNQVTSITYADGGMVRYAYNALGNAETVTDQNGNVTAYTYDALGRRKTVTDAENHVTEYFYDAVGNTVKVTVDGNTVSESEYNKVNRVKSVSDGLGNTATYIYDGVGNVTAYTDREGNTTRYSYNKNYQLAQVQDAEGYTRQTEYDALGRAVKVVDQNGQTKVTAYDANGNTTGITDALGGVVSYTYDSMNRVTKATDKLGATTTYSYDAAGNLLKTTDALGGTVTYVYDAGGNRTQYTNRENEWIKYEYDSMNRLVKETNQLNHATAYEYDLVGNRVAVIDGNKNRTEYAYNGLNQLVSEKNAEGGVTEYTYNYLGKTASVTVDGGNGSRATTVYTYDKAGNLVKEASPLGYETSYVYNKEGNIAKKTDENGSVTSYTYDKLYRMTKRTDTDGTATFTYDGLSNILTAQDGNGTISFTYDALSRTTQVTNEDGTNTGYTYDAAGNRSSITYPDGTSVTTMYDVLGNVASLTDYDGSGITYTRDAEGRVIKEAHSDGSTTEYDYNAAGLLTLQKEVTKNHSTRRQIAYTYDDADNLTSENRSGVDIDKKDELVRYYYDKANQLVKTTVEGKTTTYTYDLAGNLISDGDNTYTYDTQNRLLTKTGADGTTSYEYDAAGNLIKETNPDGTVSYTYNAQNRLIKGELSDGQSSSYTYNALGVRIENVQVRENKNSGYQNAPLNNGSTYIKDYTGALSDFRALWQRVWETEVGTVVQNDFETVTTHYTVDYLSIANRDIMATEDGSFVQRYVYDESGKRISAEFSYADGTERGTVNANGEYGENIASDTAVNNIGKVWYRTSLLNSTLFAVDADGEVVAHMIYDAWGNPLVETYTDTNFSGLDNLNNFTGYTWDETLDLYYAQNRFYDAELHRFTQEDAVKDGANWYVYCANGPTIYVDTDGLMRIIDSSYVDKYKNGDGKVGGTDYISQDIRLLQKRLQALGYLSETFSRYGYFDNLTCRAVNSYKEATGLYNKGNAYGMVGPTTWAYLGLPFDAFESWKYTHAVIFVEKGVIRIDSTQGTLKKAEELTELYAIALQAKEVYKQAYGEDFNVSDGSLYTEIVGHIMPYYLSSNKKEKVWNWITERTKMIDSGDNIIHPDRDRPIWDYLAGDIGFFTMLKRMGS